MKKKIHPKMNKIKVQMTDGTEFETMSTWGSEGEVMKLDIDPKSHPAWTGETQRVQDKGRVTSQAKHETLDLVSATVLLLEWHRLVGHPPP